MKRLTAAVLALLLMLSLCGCGTADAPAKTDGQTVSVSWDELVFDRTMPLRYAQQFTVEYAGESYKRITINNDRVYLLVAEGAAVPDGIPSGVTVLHQRVPSAFTQPSTIFVRMGSLSKSNAVSEFFSHTISIWD